MDPIHEEQCCGLTIKIMQDDNVECPHEWGSLFGTMSFFNDRHDFGTPEKQAEQYFRTAEDLVEFLKEQGEKVIALPVYIYDHSGTTIRCGRFDCPWDSGQLGFIWISKAEAAKEILNRKTKKPIKHWTPAAVARVEEMLRASVKTMDQWMTGDVYGWIVEDADGEHLESVWGYYGFDKDDGSRQYILDEARSSALSIFQAAQKKAEFYAEEDRIISSMH